jgi:peptidoglycan L-alanyl-D-glutamate endopeptidase CwlK
MASRAVQDLHPTLVPLALAFQAGLKKKGIDIIFTCTFRSFTEQNELFALGRTQAGNIVTWAKGGESKHNYSMNGRPAAKAFDCVPIVNGKAYWQTEGDAGKIWQIIGLEGKNLGLSWAGDWSKAKREYPHFEIN